MAVIWMTYKPTVRDLSRRRARPALAILAALLLAGCAASPEAPKEAPTLYFPPPPEEPRFIFERTVSSSADVTVLDETSRLRQLVTGERRSGRGFGKPFDVVACQGRIYVSDTVQRLVLVFDVPGRRFFEIGAEEPGSLSKPLGVNVDDACNLYVVDGTARRLVVYDKDGRYLRSLGGRDWFNRPGHVAVTGDGAKAFVVDTGGVESTDHRVRVFDARTGAHIRDIGTRGNEPGQLNLPRDAEIGKDGLLYVVDGANFRVQTFTQEGEFVRTFGAVGRRFGQFSRPKGIAVDADNNLYVSDAAFGNFQIFTAEGQLLMFVGDRSATPDRAKYMLPAGIDVDEDGRVYMVDQFFRKLDIFRPAALPKDGGHVGAWYRPVEKKEQASR